MKEQFIKSVEEAVGGFLSQGQIAKLSEVLSECMQGYELTRKETSDEKCKRENGELLQAFLAAKKIEGCSEKTVHYYQSSVEKLFVNVVKNVTDMTTNDIRNYLAENQRLKICGVSFQVSLHGWKMKIIFPKVPCEEYIR